MPAPRKSAFSSLASTSAHARLPDALAEWVRAQPAVTQGGRAVNGLDDLKDGAVLGHILVDIDPDHFRPIASSASNAKALSENWVLRFNSLKREYKLVVRYFEDILHSSTAGLHTPNLQLAAKNGALDSDDEVCKLIGLVLALCVQSNHKEQHIARIQGLEEWVQRELMYSIEQVMSKVRPADIREEGEDNEDDEFYELRHEKSRVMHDKEALQTVYDDLVEQFNALKDEHEEALSKLAEGQAKVAELTAEAEQGKAERAGQTYKFEVDRLRAELQKTENQLSETEQVVESQTALLEELSRKVQDLTPKAEEAARLKDQMDEYRHASEKAKKQENVLEKYRKKLEEAGEMRSMLKTLEDQNADLLDKYAALEEEHAKVASSKSLLESYKSKLDALDIQSATQAREATALRLELERTKEKLAASEEGRVKDKEALVLFEERVKELELAQGADGENEGTGVGGELDDALAGTTPTDLKLQLRRLQRELDRTRGDNPDPAKVAVLESLLDDANRMKKRYEADYLNEHRNKLVLAARLEEIMSGKSSHGDGPEVAFALRQRLNETVDEPDLARRNLAELQIKLDAQERELTIAKSDLSLVDKDQRDILSSLRASVSAEKDSLQAELDRVSKALRDAEDKARAHAEQAHQLLVEKVALQDDGIEQREKALERERENSDLRVSLSGKSATAADAAELASLERELAEQTKIVQEQQDKIQKMKTFIRDQDRTLRQAAGASSTEETEELRQLKSQLEQDLQRAKTQAAEVEATYKREHQLMLSAWHDLGMRTMRERLTDGLAGGSSSSGARTYQPQSWLSQQRARANGKGLRNG